MFFHLRLYVKHKSGHDINDDFEIVKAKKYLKIKERNEVDFCDKYGIVETIISFLIKKTFTDFTTTNSNMTARIN